jgi:phosphoglycerate dehydrogenase-like enzyme
MTADRPTGRTTLLVATPLEPELVDRIRREAPQVEVLFDPDLLSPPRYPCDHAGDPSFALSAEQEQRFDSMLERAEVVLGVPGETPASLRSLVERAPRLRWLQGTAAGAGQQVGRAGLDPSLLERVTFTSSTGVHATQLAEWAVLGLLYFTKDVPRLLRDRESRAWGHYPVRELGGRRLLVVGLGHIGREVARAARALGMHVTGVRRRPDDRDLEHVDETAALADLAQVVPRCDAVVLALPSTAATDGVFGADLVDAIPDGGVLVNVGRGTTVDEGALVRALRSGRLAGAALDVFATEPLPEDSPLWELDNVLISPHTAALSVHENERIVDVLVENLHRFLDGRPLRNVVDVEHFY